LAKWGDEAAGVASYNGDIEEPSDDGGDSAEENG